DVTKVKDAKSPAYNNALLALYLNTRGLALDAARTKKIDELTAGVGAKLEKHQAAVMDGIKNLEPVAFSTILDENRKPYRFTVADLWFQQAEKVANMKYSVKVLEAQQTENPKMLAANKKQLAAQVQDLEKQMSYPALKQELTEMLVSLKVP